MSDGKSVVNYDAAYAALAVQQQQDNPVSGGLSISMQGGILSYQEAELAGNQMAMVVLDSIYENTYFPGAYDPDNRVPPTCYAFARGKAEANVMGPHESMADHLDYFDPQSDTCGTCQWSVFGSADVGRGKACKEKRRLMMIPAGWYQPVKPKSKDLDLHLFDDPKEFESADLIRMTIPVLSVANWSKYVQAVTATHNLPTCAVVTRIWLEPDAKAPFKVHFEMVEKLPPEMAQVILAKQEQAMQQIITAYQPPDPQQREQQDGQRRGAPTGLRRR